MRIRLIKKRENVRIYVQVKNPSKFEHKFEEEWVEIETPTGEKIKKKVPPYSVHVVSKINGTEDIETKEFKRSLMMLVNPFKVSRNPFVSLEPPSLSNFSNLKLPFGIPNYLFVIGQDPKYFKYGTPETLHYLQSSEKWKHFKWSDLSKDQKIQILEETRWSIFDSEDRELSHWIIQKQLKKLPEESFLSPSFYKKPTHDSSPFTKPLEINLLYKHLLSKKSPFHSLHSLQLFFEQKEEEKIEKSLDIEKMHPDAFIKKRKELWRKMRTKISPEKKKKWQIYEYHYLRIPMDKTLYSLDLLFQYSLPYFYSKLKSKQLPIQSVFLKKKVTLSDDFSWILESKPKKKKRRRKKGKEESRVCFFAKEIGMEKRKGGFYS
jgi:hypothetical protein